MVYLIVQISLLLVLAAAGGGLLSFWWCRRNFVDVTDAHRQLQTERDLALRALDTLRQEPTDFSPVLEALEAWPRPEPVDLQPVLDALSSIQAIPEPAPVDLAPVLSAIEALPPPPQPADLGPVLAAIAELPRPEPVDLGPVLDTLRALPKPSAPVDLGPVLAAIEGLGEPKPADLSPVLSAIAAIPEPERVDLAPLVEAMRNLPAILERFDRLEQRLSQLDPTPALVPIEGELSAIRQLLEGRASRPEDDAIIPYRRPEGSNLLVQAAFGPPDDLRRISGVGPKIERLLNEVGVYYFWQVADWGEEDIEKIDALLTGFKGRIERDQWVQQAQALSGPRAAERAS